MHPLVAKARKLHALEVKLLGLASSPFLLLVRVVWGWQFAQAGWGKMGDLAKVTDYFRALGIPAPGANAVVAGTTELVGGLLLLFGLGSRIVTLPLAFTMLVAYGTAHREEVSKLLAHDPDPFLAAPPFLFLLASLLVLIFGPGALSIDALVARALAHEDAKAASKT